MSPQLAAFVKHCRRMTTAAHRPDCTTPDTCAGCITDRDRVLWGRLAAEAAAYREPRRQDLVAG